MTGKGRLKLAACIMSLIAVLFYGSNAMAADPQNGSGLYSRHCVNCHGADGAGTMPGVPDFRRGDSMMKPDAQLVTLIRDGRAVMPAFQGIMSDSEIGDVVAYLRTLR